MTTETNGTALAVREATDLAPRFVVSLDELRLQVRQLEEFKRDIMVEDVDYGTIPGTPKPTLLKPGAEKLALAFGLTPVFSVTNKIEDWGAGFFHYEITCDIFSKRNGERVANGIGSANSKEPRYRWRDAKPACPDCGFDLRRSKNDGGWYCWQKIGGCGAQFQKDAVKLAGRIENPEPYELVNTLLKMGEKRALVAAVLVATGGSGIWTQDIEDMPSVAGDYTPMREREVVDVPPRPQPEMVRSADNRVWQRWLEVLAKARGLNVPATEVRLPVSMDELKAEASRVLEGIARREAELAAQQARIYGTEDENDHMGSIEIRSAAPTAEQPAREPETGSSGSRGPVMVTSKRSPLWADFNAARAQAEAEGLNVPFVALPLSEESLQAATAELREAIETARGAVAEG